MKREKSRIVIRLVILIAIIIPYYCIHETSAASKMNSRPEGWTDKTHGSNTSPNYEVIFPQDKVNKIEITITRPDDWEAMQANMTELFGVQGKGKRGRQPGPDGVRPEISGVAPGDILKGEGKVPNPGIPGWVDMTPENPVWVPATIEFNGLTWTNVGLRYKGGSSLTSGWRRGILKLPFKLDFDEFENEYPEINNQRFYGFKQLSLSNVFSDRTYIREAIANDILVEAGLVAAETAYYEVILDYGEGPINLGLYLMVEVIDDTVINRFFGGNSGNIYEGDGPGVSLERSSFSRIKSSFLKENNIQEADWSDIEELYNVLHSENRTSNPEAWRESLESIFNVNVFLEWLAISAIIQHWDTYGSMSHNFYLYHDPGTGALTWISWDHNMVLEVGGGRGRRDGMLADRGRMGDSASLGREEVGQKWPLIRYLLDDPIYHGCYIEYIEETIKGAFNPDKIAEKCHRLAELILPYATKDFSKTAFESAVTELINRIYERFEAANAFLDAGR